MISNKYGFIFLHIPKCGGTSLQKVLHKYSEDDRFKYWHSPLSEYQKFYNISNYRIICSVRNPWSRIVSAFNYLQQGGNRSNYDLKLSRDLNIKDNTFENFILNDLEYAINFEAPANHFKPMINYFKGFNVHYIMKCESLQEHFNIVCKGIGLSSERLPHSNKSHHKHYTEYYNEQTKNIIEKKYSKDIKFFNYNFGS